MKAFGHGLSLYLMKKALEKLGGAAKVESKEDIFTRFKFYIPDANLVEINHIKSRD